VVAASAGGALCIGDSVMQSASPQYYNFLGMCGIVDATVSRSWGAASSTLAGHAPYPDRVVIHLGTNGFTNAGEIDAALQPLAGVPRVVLVNVQLNGSRRWEASVNDEILAAAARWPNVRIADWRSASAGHPEYFRPDRIHPTRDGAQVYANVIAGAL
jgi:lysophospholipase L1-like esterase